MSAAGVVARLDPSFDPLLVISRPAFLPPMTLYVERQRKLWVASGDDRYYRSLRTSSAVCRSCRSSSMSARVRCHLLPRSNFDIEDAVPLWYLVRDRDEISLRSNQRWRLPWPMVVDGALLQVESSVLVSQEGVRLADVGPRLVIWSSVGVPLCRRSSVSTGQG
jgi:hypothetical protein